MKTIKLNRLLSTSKFRPCQALKSDTDCFVAIRLTALIHSKTIYKVSLAIYSVTARRLMQGFPSQAN